MSAGFHDAEERLLTFEIGGSLFAMPIAGVLEVAEATGEACIPTVPTRVARVMNYRGDALPVVCRERLLGLSAPRGDDAHVLVVTDRRSPVPRFGLDVDRVLGLVDCGAAPPGHGSVVAERRQVGERMASVLDPGRLVARAREMVEGAFDPGA